MNYEKILIALSSITLLSNFSIPIMATKYINSNSNRQPKKQKKPRNSSLSPETKRKKHHSKLKQYSNIFKNKNFKSFIRETINYFQAFKNIESCTVNDNAILGSKKIFKLAKNNNSKYIIIPLNSYNGDNGIENKTNEIELVFNTSNLYLEGFIAGIDENKIYWHFSDSEIKKLSETENASQQGNKNIPKSESLEFSGNYSTLVKNNNIIINKENINAAINNLSAISNNNKNERKDDLIRTIFVSSEAMRFFSVREAVEKVLNSEPKNITWQNYEGKLKNWKKYSNLQYERLIEGKYPDNKIDNEKMYDVAILALENIEE